MQRTIDIIISASALILLSPFMLLLALITEVLTPGAFVRHHNRLKFRPVHPAMRHLAIDDLPGLIDVLLGHQTLSDRKTRELFWTAKTRTEFDWKLAVFYGLVWLLIALGSYILYLNFR